MTNLDEVLGGDDVYTLYAPDNNAFIGFLMRSGFNSLEEVPRETLKQILLNHVMIGQMEYRDFKSGYFQTAATSPVNGNAMSIYINQVNMRVTLNGESRIIQGNVRASNGIIHLVDRIIPLPSLVTFVLGRPTIVQPCSGTNEKRFDSRFHSGIKYSKWNFSSSFYSVCS